MDPNESLPPNQQLIDASKWPVVGEKTCPDVADWQLKIFGLVEQDQVFDLQQLQQFSQIEQSIDIHCVTRWSKLNVKFTGILLAKIFEVVQPKPSARFVWFGAHSDRNHSTSVAIDHLLDAQAMIAFRADGQPLARENGGPIRMVVPGKYFYKSIKWLNGIELLSQDRLGYWEAEAGYHNNADPWREERFVASKISKQEAAKLIAFNDFSNRDLLGIDCSQRSLSELNAKNAQLRNANFSSSFLRNAKFDTANLSGADLTDSDLRDASFRHADLEGADFVGANLIGTDFTNASLFGATFRSPYSSASALISNSTIFSRTSINQLTDGQIQYVLSKKPRVIDDPA